MSGELNFEVALSIASGSMEGHEKAPEGLGRSSACGSSPRHCVPAPANWLMGTGGKFGSSAATLRAEPLTHGDSLGLRPAKCQHTLVVGFGLSPAFPSAFSYSR